MKQMLTSKNVDLLTAAKSDDEEEDEPQLPKWATNWKHVLYWAGQGCKTSASVIATMIMPIATLIRFHYDNDFLAESPELVHFLGGKFNSVATYVTETKVDLSWRSLNGV